jgi:hypothetical protein
MLDNAALKDLLQQRLIVGMRGGPHEAVGRTACPSPCTLGWPLRGWHADAGGPLALWRNWSDDVEGCPLNAGHFFPEEIPNETADALNRFFRCGFLKPISSANWRLCAA